MVYSSGVSLVAVGKVGLYYTDQVPNLVWLALNWFLD